MVNKRKKTYSENEETFIRAAVKLGEEYGLTNAAIAREIADFLGRTKKGVEQKIGFVRGETEEKTQEIITQEAKKNVAYRSFSLEDVGKMYKVKVHRILSYGAFCHTEDGKSGLLLKSLITNQFVTSIDEYLQVGDEFTVLVVRDPKKKGEHVLLNAKIIGNIIPIKERM